MGSKTLLTYLYYAPHYADTLKVFLASLAVNAPGERIIVYISGCEGGTFSGINENALFRHWDVDSVENANRFRFAMLLNILEEYEYVGWLDHDMIVRKPINELWRIKDNTLHAWYRRKKREHMKVQGGVFFLKRSERIKKYLTDVMNLLKADAEWYAPQLYCYQYAVKNGIAFSDIGEQYNDCKFKEGSVLWHCKSSHFDDPKYQKEHQVYLSKANAI